MYQFAFDLKVRQYGIAHQTRNTLLTGGLMIRRPPEPALPPARQQAEDREKILAPWAARSSNAMRLRVEDPCPLRTAFQRDRDRILHSKAFRRLAYKTQVFINTAGDHYRTRLTHTLEVSQIARTLASILLLNEDLVEAIALGHDLGHTPFGHSGERVIRRLNPDGFTHQAQSLRIVDHLEKDGAGLNLCMAVRDGILKHSKGRGPIFAYGEGGPYTVEGQLVRAADIIAYLAHDLDDAVRSGLISYEALPYELRIIFGESGSKRISAMVGDLLANSMANDGANFKLSFSKPVEQAMHELREFLHIKVYQSPRLLSTLEQAEKMVESVYLKMIDDVTLLLKLFPAYRSIVEQEGQIRAVTDAVAGMTDRYLSNLYHDLFGLK